MNLQKVLEDYGLEDKQAKVYLAALELGSGSVASIADKANLPRSTTYVTLEGLQQRALVSSFRKKKVKWFSAQDPKTIIELGRQKIDLLQKAMPQFVATFGSARVKPSVRFYLGKEGMDLVLEEILSEAKELMSFSSTKDLFTTIPGFPDFVRRRAEKRIPVRVLARDSEEARERKRLGPRQLRQLKLLPKDFEYHGTLLIWENKTALFSFGKEKSVLVTESEEIMKVQKAMFELLWRSLPG